MRKSAAISGAALALLLATAAHAGGPSTPPTGPVCLDDDGCEAPNDPGSNPTAPTGGGGGGGTTTPVTSNFSSAFTTYSTRAAFNSATTTGVTDNFEGVASPSSGGIGNYAFPSGTYTDPNGITFSASTNGSVVNLNILDSTYVNGANQIGNKFGSDVLTSGTEALTVNFAPTTAFAIDLGAQGIGFTNTTATFTFTVAGQTQTVAYNGSGLNFFGFSSTTPFDTVVINSSANNRFYDNVTIASAAAVSAAPEPGAWVLMLGGVGVMGLMLRRRRPAVTNYAV